MSKPLTAEPKRPNGAKYAVIAVALLILFVVGQPIAIIPAGHAGVVDLYGHVPRGVLSSGLQLKTLLASVKLFSLKTMLVEVTQDVPTTEGLIVELDVSVLYHIDPQRARELYITIGTNYQTVLVMPEITSTIRSLTSRVSAKALYSAGRDDLSIGITAELNSKLNPRGIVVEQALLRKVVLPRLVTTAIEEKLKAEQDSQRMEFVLTKEKQEADRKRLEAQGIADFQAIVSRGISTELLQWKGIEATERLAASNNAKVVVIGSQKTGLPLILGDAQPQQQEQQQQFSAQQLQSLTRYQEQLGRDALRGGSTTSQARQLLEQAE